MINHAAVAGLGVGYCEDVHVTAHHRLETGRRVVGVRAIQWHVLWALVAMHVVAMAWL